VAEGLLLHPASYLVDDIEAELHDVEAIQHPGRMRQGSAQCGRVAAERVQSGHRDPGPPTVVSGQDPTRQRRTGPALHDVEQPGSPVERDDPGREHGPCRRCRGQERGLIHPDRVHTSEPVRVVDQRLTVLDDRRHDRVPPGTQISRDGGHGVTILADPAARFSADPLGQ